MTQFKYWCEQVGGLWYWLVKHPKGTTFKSATGYQTKESASAAAEFYGHKPL